jgi:hypothetical protein
VVFARGKHKILCDDFRERKSSAFSGSAEHTGEKPNVPENARRRKEMFEKAQRI